MKTKFSQKLLNGLKPENKPYRVHDTNQPGLFIRVLPSGHMSYRAPGYGTRMSPLAVSVR